MISPTPTSRRAIIAAITAMTIFSAQLSGVSADSNPATTDLASACTVTPEFSQGLQSGQTAVGIGEAVTLTSSAAFDEGTVFQDVLKRPDGSTYYASAISLRALASPLNLNPSGAQLFIEGELVPTVVGSAPDPTKFVMSTTPDAEGVTFTVYFPGDEAAMLAAEEGHGVASYTVPAGGQLFEVSAEATLVDGPGATAGLVHPVLTCETAISSGPSNLAYANAASIAVVEPNIQITKSVSPTQLSPGGTATYVIGVSNQSPNPELVAGDAYDVVITDSPSAGLIPLTEAGVPAGIGDEVASGGVWDGTNITFTLNKLGSELSVPLTYRMKVDPTIDPNTAPALTNSAVADSSSLPGTGANAIGERQYQVGPVNTTAVAGAAAPTITKSASPGIANIYSGVRYTSQIVIPPNASPIFDVTFRDTMEPGLVYNSDNPLSVVCTSGCIPGDPAGAAISPRLILPDTSQRVGWRWPELQPSPSQRVYTVTYWGYMTYSNGVNVTALGDRFDNTASIGYNSVARLGEVQPNITLDPTFDAQAQAVATVEYGRPILRIEKTVNESSPLDPSPTAPLRYTIKVSNIGNVEARSISIPESQVLNFSGGLPANVSAAGTNISIASILPGAEVVFSGTAPWTPNGLPSRTNFAYIAQHSSPSGENYFGTIGASNQSAVTTDLLAPKVVVTKSGLDNPASVSGPVRWRVDLTNTGLGTAYNVSVVENLPPGWSIQSVSGTASYPGTGATFSLSSPLAPGASTSVIVTTSVPSGTTPGDFTNAVNVTWKDGTASTSTRVDGVPVSYSATAEATVELDQPRLAVSKTPDLDALPTPVIQEGGSGNFSIAVQNPSAVTVRDIEITDLLPAELDFDSVIGWQVLPEPAVPPMVGTADTATGPVWTVSELAAGSVFQVTYQANQTGDVPADGTMVNEVIVTAAGTTQVSDNAAAFFAPNIATPRIAKLAAPVSGAPGDQTTYTITATVPENSVAVYDLLAEDNLPDGITFGSVVSATCSGPCPNGPPTQLATSVDAGGKTRLAWSLGDHPASSADSVYTFVYTAMIAEYFTDGAQVVDGFREPLVNRARVFYTVDPLLNQGGLAPGGPLPTPLPQYRTASASAEFDVQTPSLELKKSLVGLTPYDWENVESGSTTSIYALNPGQQVTYELLIKNIGSAPAIDAVIADDLAQGELSNLSFTLPAGVTRVIQGDGAVHFILNNPLPAGSSIVIRYTGTVPTSAQLSPDLSGDDRDVDAVINIAEAVEYHSLGTGEPGDVTFTQSTAATVEGYIFTPTLETVVDACFEVAPGASQVVSLDWSNWITRSATHPPTPTVPMDTTVGAAVAPVLTVVMPLGLTYVPGTAVAKGLNSTLPTSALRTPFRNPDSISVDALGSQVLVWNFPDTPYTTTGHSLDLAFSVANGSTEPVDTVIRSIITADDASGSPSRGTTSGDSHTYRSEWVAGCSSFELVKTPDSGDYFPGDVVTWQFETQNDPIKPIELTNGILTDTLPVGLTYTANSLTLKVTELDGSVTTYMAGDAGSPDELITTLPDGRNRLTWSGGALSAGPFLSVSGSIDSVIDIGAPVNRTVVNYVDFRSDQELFDSCVEPNTECDTGSIFILDPSVPQISKSVSRDSDVYGSSDIVYSLRVLIPAYSSYTQLKVVDQPREQPFLPMIDSTFGTISASCISGCSGGATDINVTEMARTTTSYTSGPNTVVATKSAQWFLGNVESAETDRVVEIRYSARMANLTELPTLSNAAVDASGAERTFLNDAALRSNSGTCAGAGCSQSVSSGTSLDSATASVTLRYPWVSQQKSCVAADGSPHPSPALSGANLLCTITLTNETQAAAYDLRVRDYPAATAVRPNNQGTYPVAWNVVQYGGASVPSAPWSSNLSDGTGRYIEWYLAELAPGASVELKVDFNVDGWVNMPANIASHETPAGSNTSRLFPWAMNSGDTAKVGVATNSRAEWMFRPTGVATKKLRVHSDSEGAVLLDQWLAAPETLDSGLPPEASTYEEHLPGDDIQWAVHGYMRNKSDLAAVSVIDTLPAGVDYVPGSAKLVWADRDSTTGIVLDAGFTGIGDPGVTAGTNLCPEFGDESIGGTGDQLRWSFVRNDASWPGEIWRRTGTAEQRSEPNMFSDPNGHFIVVYDVVHTDEVNTCINPTKTSGHGMMVNSVRIDATTAASRAVAPASAEFRYAYHNPLELQKRPDGGIVSDGSDTGFDIDVTWWMWGSHDVTTWTPELTAEDDPHVMGPVVFVDTFVDDGLYVPGTATAVMIGPDGTSYTVDLEEVSLVAGTDSASGRENKTITWRLPSIPPSARDSSNPYDRSNPYRRTPVRLQLDVPFSVPVGTPDGTRYRNEVDLEIGANPPAGDPTFIDGPALTDSDGADVTVANPSPPPPAAKAATPAIAAPGQLVDWAVTLELPATQVWFDLSYTDDLPEGLEFVGPFTAACETESGVDCSGDLDPRMLAEPAPGAAGPLQFGWYFGDVRGDGEDRTVTLGYKTRVALNQQGGATLTNTVTGWSNETDVDSDAPTSPVTDGDFTSGVTTADVAVQEPHLSIDKAASSSGPLSEGQTVTYQVTVSNTSLVSAYDFNVNDYPSATLGQIVLQSNKSFATKGWTASDPRISWYVPSLAPGASLTFTYTARVRVGFAADGSTTADNYVIASRYFSATKGRPRVGYDPVSDKLSIPLAGPRLTINKFASSSCTPVTATFATGTPFAWCIEATNTGSAPMTQVDITDILPVGWTYQASSALLDGAQTEPTLTTTSWGAQRLVWPVGDVAAGITHRVTFNAVASLAADPSAVNTASAQGRLPDGSLPPTTATGYRSTATASASRAAASVEISKAPDYQEFGCLPTGCDVSWTITVANPGNSAVTDVSVIDSLPSGLAWVSSTLNGAPSGWSQQGGDIAGPNGSLQRTWAGPSMAAGESFTITVTARIDGAATDDLYFVNDVELTAAEVSTTVANQAKARAYGPAVIGDFVWEDLNGDGLQSPGEPGISGVTVELLDEEGLVIDTAQTLADGSYEFVVAPDSYRVRFTSPATMLTTGQGAGTDPELNSDVHPTTGLSSLISVGADERRTDIDAGFIRLTRLGDTVWFDDGDGNFEPSSESGVSGVVVTLVGVQGDGVNVDRTVTTNASGQYLFDNLKPGVYTIRFELPDGRVFTQQSQGSGLNDSDADPATGSVGPISMVSGLDRLDIDAGLLFAPSSIGDLVWLDTNGDGISDPGEPGIPGLTVTAIWYGPDGVLGTADDEVFTTGTDANGVWKLDALPPGRFDVSVTPPAGTTPTFDVDGVASAHRATIDLEAGQDRNDVDFGYLGSARLGDRIWHDVNNDGIQDDGEPGIAGISVTATTVIGSENFVFTTTADSLGNYNFEGLPTGTYIVAVDPGTLPASVRPSGDADGVATPHRSSVTLTDVAPVNLAQDFGYSFPPASFGDHIWHDLDRDGALDANELPLAGVSVLATYLGPDGKLGGGDDIRFTATTDANGNYSFTDVPFGEYLVEIDTNSLPTGIRVPTFDLDGPGTPNLVRVQLGEEQIRLDVDFGYWKPVGGISGLVFEDVNNNGDRDAGEGPIAGATITVVDAAGNIVATTLSGADGTWRVVGLEPGTYSITETTPAGYRDGTDAVGSGGGTQAERGDIDRIVSVVVTAGEVAGGYLFGEVRPQTLSGILFIDATCRAEPGPESRLLGNVDVELRLPDGSVRTTRTDSSGAYAFTDLPAGPFEVTIASGQGYKVVGDCPATPGKSQTSVAGLNLLVAIGEPTSSGTDGSAARPPALAFTGGTWLNTVVLALLATAAGAVMLRIRRRRERRS